MKTIRIYFIISAMVLSIGAAIASTLVSNQLVYQWVDNPGLEDDMCIPVMVEGCSETGFFPCQCLLSTTLRKSGIEFTQCGQELYKGLLPICF